MNRKILWLCALLCALFIVPTLVSAQCTTPTDGLYINADTTLCSGEYDINASGSAVLFMNASSVTLSCNGTILSGNNSAYAVSSTAASSAGSTIANCTFRNYANGMLLQNGAVDILNNTLQNITSVGLFIDSGTEGALIANNTLSNISSGSSTGINGGADTIITENTLTNAGSRAIGITTENNVTITSNVITGSSSAIYLSAVTNSTIQSNNITNPTSRGIEIDSGSSGNFGLTIQGNIINNTGSGEGMRLYEMNESLVTGNIVRFSAGEGLVLDTSYNSNITSNTFTNGSDIGVDIDNSTTIVFEGNTIAGNGDVGLDLDPNGMGTDISGSFDNNNISFNAGAGIAFSQNGQLITLDNNTVAYNQGDGLDGLSANDRVTNNTITNNTGYGIDLSTSGQTGQTIDANTITLNGLGGIRVGSAATGVTIRFNTVQYNNASPSAQYQASLSPGNYTPTGTLFNVGFPGDFPFPGTEWTGFDGTEAQVNSSNEPLEIPFADGTNNFSVALMVLNTSELVGPWPEELNVTYVHDSRNFTNCNAIETFWNNTASTICVYYAEDVYIAQGAGNNYTINTNLNFSGTETNPPTLNYATPDGTVSGVTINAVGVTMYNNTVSDNAASGIIVSTNDSVITNNTIEGHSGDSAAGIYLQVGTGNNSIYNNYLNNTNNSYDNGTGNLWNRSKLSGTNIIGGSNLGGNFYSDYTGRDDDSDGLGETIYTILNNGNDSLPLTNTEGNEPNATAAVPTAGTVYNVTDTIEIAANATDDVGIGSVVANITLPNGTVQQVTLTNASGGDEFNNTFTIPSLLGQYNVTYVVNDTSGNLNTSLTTNFNATDGINPAVTNAVPTAGTTGDTTDAIEIAVNVTDAIAVDTVLANVTLPNGSVDQITLTNASGGEEFNLSFSNTSQVGTYNVTFIANDTSSNVNDSVTTNFTLSVASSSSSSSSGGGGGGGGSSNSGRVECQDRRDNDGDGLIDMRDPDCTNTGDDNEGPEPEDDGSDDSPTSTSPVTISAPEQDETQEESEETSDSPEEGQAEEPSAIEGAEDSGDAEAGKASKATIGFIAVTLAILIFAGGYYYFGRKPPKAGAKAKTTKK